MGVVCGCGGAAADGDEAEGAVGCCSSGEEGHSTMEGSRGAAESVGAGGEDGG